MRIAQLKQSQKLTNPAFIKFEEHLAQKEVSFKEDFTTATVLVFLKKNTEHHFFVPDKRASVLWSCLMSQLMVTLMLSYIGWAIIINENNEYPITQPHNFQLMMIKLPTILALHFLLSPEVENGMRIMKYANQ